MKKILFILLFFNIYYVDAGYNYPYICENEYCYNTNFGVLDSNDRNGYYLSNENIIDINNFKSFLDEKLNYYSNYYGDINLTIKKYYTSSGELIDYKITLEDLFLIDSEILIGEKGWWGQIKIIDNYISGKDYFFSNFQEIIDELHSLSGFPRGDKKNNLSTAILKNILNYSSEEKFNIRNVCIFDKCDENSDNKMISIKDTSSYSFLSGDIKSNRDFNADNFIVSENYIVSSYLLKAGESLKFDFGFEDYLDTSETSTSYQYKIGYKYENDINITNYLTEEINISNDFNISSDNIGDEIIGDIINLEILNNRFKKFRLGIKEGLTLTKPGKIYFYLSVKNLNTGSSFEEKQINFAPIEVLHSDNIGLGESQITTPFSKELNNNGFNIGDTFSISLNLKDIYGNEHFDYVENGGYEISLSEGSSNKIKLSKVGSDQYYDKLIGVKTTSQTSPYYVNFKFKIISDGYHDLTGFKIKVTEKETISSYKIPANYFLIDNIIPNNLYDYNLDNDTRQLMKIYIKSPLISDFDLTCSRGPITIRSICMSDNFSGCNPSFNISKTFTSESENGSTGILSIRDYAYNVKNYNYSMNHIDRTAPNISINKSGTNLVDNEYFFKANDDSLKINFYEPTTSNCSAKINYIVKLDGTTVYDSSFDGANFELSYNDFFKTSGVGKILYVKATDNYGNFSELTKTFNIFPTDLDENKTTISVNSNGNRYANNSDYYEYTLNLKDKYNNPIYGKKITYINQEEGSITGDFKRITTNMINNSGDDALVEYDYTFQTDSNGQIKFKLKSLSPGEFTQRFLLKIKNWGNDYVDNNTETLIIKGINGNNKFKKPVIGKIKVIEGGNIPELRKEQKYKIPLLNNGNLSGYSNGNINISSSTIISDIVGHFWNTFNNINGVFNNNLSNNLTFLGELDANDNILKTPIIKNNNLEISYNLGGKNIKYYLDDFQTEATCDLETLGVKVYGILQGDGKSDITGQEENFSDLSKSSLRGNIRKNAYELIKNRTSNTIINNVKYIEGDYTISGEQNYETLILKDGNLIINGDLNNSGKKLGIIILRDNFNILTDYNNKGNIYVTNNVEKIDAIIYSDGAFRSLKEDGNEYSDSDLNKKLELYGSLFTRNTIGGAVLGGTNYTLPGGQITTNYELAEIYDLNYIRKVNNTCSGNPEDNYSFIIKYNPNVQSNPPKGFSNN